MARSEQGDVPARPVISRVRPVVDGGRYPAKASLGEAVVVEADVFADGTDLLACEVQYQEADRDWVVVPMRPLGNDRWRAEVTPSRLGRLGFRIEAWIDRLGTWERDLAAKAEAGQPVDLDLQMGEAIVAQAADRGVVARSSRFDVVVDRARARFGSWYELFPRSASPDPSRPGTLADVVDRLGYLRLLGVDVLYLPPIHPIGTTDRKGRYGRPTPAGEGHRRPTPAGEGHRRPTPASRAHSRTADADPGSPWAIGGPEGGHEAIHPDLGTAEDLRRLVAEARAAGIEVALDLAFQCSPDHPWVTEHPEWFRHRPDGTIRFAENPPKRYEDIYPLDFETEHWWALWQALRDVVEHWIGEGITIFRVDNPHTKPFGFWEWLIAEVRERQPEVIFLAEAFSRPAIMYHLGKVGFSQSYTYFAWRTAKWELESYMNELVHSEVADYFRPNLWPNTPDILTAQLQQGGPAVFASRLILAGTLAASYGIYGPAFELGEQRPAEPGSEEYWDSEKYAQRTWDLERADSLAPLVGRLNGIRRGHPSLQQNATLRFHRVDNDQLLAYSKTAPLPDGRTDIVVAVVNLDGAATQSGWVHLDLGALGIEPHATYEMVDLLTGTTYRWEASPNYVILDPVTTPAHLFCLQPLEPEPWLLP